MCVLVFYMFAYNAYINTYILISLKSIYHLDLIGCVIAALNHPFGRLCNSLAMTRRLISFFLHTDECGSNRGTGTQIPSRVVFGSFFIPPFHHDTIQLL